MSKNEFKKAKLIKAIRANGFSQFMKGIIRSKVSEENEKEQTKILIVDDELEICGIVKDMLEPIGAEIEITTSSKQALELILNTKYSLLILDISMPEIDGIRLLKLVRENNINTPVLFLSGDTSEKNLQNALYLGAMSFIEKPFNVDELLNIAQKLINHAQTENSFKKAV